MQNVLERMEAIGAERKMADFNVKMKMDYEFKKNYACIRAWEFYNECCARGLNCHVSVGGLDSITLFLFLRSIGIYVPGISVSHLEDRSIQEVHRQLGIERVQPLKRADGTVWNKAKIIQEFGFPVLSKEIASKIELLQNPSEKNKTVRHAIITGETGAYGGYQKNSRMKLSQKWLEKFGGYENETEGVNYGVPDFKVSAKCCYYLKEKPCDDWAKQHNSVPYLGLMASEGGRRAKSLKINGCNYFGKSTIRSTDRIFYSWRWSWMCLCRRFTARLNEKRMALSTPPRHSGQAAACVDLGYTWKSVRIDSTSCESGTRRNGNSGCTISAGGMCWTISVWNGKRLWRNR